MSTAGAGSGTKRVWVLAIPVGLAVLFLSAAFFREPHRVSQPLSRAVGMPDNGIPAGVAVAAIQSCSTMGDVQGNRLRLLRLVEEAAALGAQLVVLHETAVQGYQAANGSKVWMAPGFPGDEKEVSLEHAAETVPGPSTKAFGELAARLRVHVVVPIAEFDAQTRLYSNTALLIGPKGDILLHYRKAHPWTPAEYAWATAGKDELAIADTELGRIGLMICYDVHSMLTRLAEAGADIVCTPVWWVDPDPSSWFSARLPFRARLDGVAIVAANRASAGCADELPGAGYSAVISAAGELIAMAEGDGEDIVVARLTTRGPASIRTPAGRARH